LHAGYLRLQTYTLRICNAYCFSIATMVANTSLDVTLYVHCTSCSMHNNWNIQHTVSALHTSISAPNIITTSSCNTDYNMYNAVQYFEAKMGFPFWKTIPKSTALLFPSSVCMYGSDTTSANCLCISSNLALCSSAVPHHWHTHNTLTCKQRTQHIHLQTAHTTHSLANSAHNTFTCKQHTQHIHSVSVHSAMQKMMPIPVWNDSQQDAHTCH